ncbi:MAG: 2-oxoacid:acceptor oxidoreductase subunit alpha [Planctomycetia bacterium]|nr:2-oxoacid:acceptor oxidoreductase subunit alpha [Planctomycetia bacterium]
MRSSLTIRLAGDAGDSIQLMGQRLAHSAALQGHTIYTLPDFPSEIRAPVGSLPGVFGYLIVIDSDAAPIPGDGTDVLLAMNPAALKVHLAELMPGGLLLVDRDAFTIDNLLSAGYLSDPLNDASLADYRVCKVAITSTSREALEPFKLFRAEADRCKSLFALGLLCRLFDCSPQPTMGWLSAKFAKKPEVFQANQRAIEAGYRYGDSSEMVSAIALLGRYRIARARVVPGRYRQVSGHEAIALALITAATRSRRRLVYAAHPLPTAGELLHRLAELQRWAGCIFQAEDEAAAVGAAVGAAFGGCLGVTASSGNGLVRKSDAIGLAVITELPLVVVAVQHAGPSVGLSTKPEQSDLLLSLFGRNGECPTVVMAVSSPADGFTMTLEACRIALKYMTPVILLTDASLIHAAETWRIPEISTLPRLDAPLTTGPNSSVGEQGVSTPRSSSLTFSPTIAQGESVFLPYRRDQRLVRSWAVPGTPGLEHRLGGLEKEDETGHVSYDPRNHERMVGLRATKIARIADDLPPLEVNGPTQGDVLLVGWGGTIGPLRLAADRLRSRGFSVAHAHLRYLNPLPTNTPDVLRRYRTVLVAELNQGQLAWLLRGAFLIDCISFIKMQGKPLSIREIEQQVEQLLGLSTQVTG